MTPEELHTLETGGAIQIEFGTFTERDSTGLPSRAYPVLALVTDDERVRQFYGLPPEQRRILTLRVQGPLTNERCSEIYEAAQRLLALTLNAKPEDIVSIQVSGKADA
jgi:hypothetical protein